MVITADVVAISTDNGSWLPIGTASALNDAAPVGEDGFKLVASHSEALAG